MKNSMRFFYLIIFLSLIVSANTNSLTYKIVDTNQIRCYSSSGNQISCKNSSQDGEFNGFQPSYTKKSDGTVKDNNTNLIWQQTADINGDGKVDSKDKMSQSDALNYCSNLSLGGFSDWRLPNIKTLYSIMDFSGKDIDPRASSGSQPFIDDEIFDFGYGDTRAGERIIDAQWATSTIYVSTTMNNDETMFGVNFADGRIKGYPLRKGWSDKLFYVQCVRGNEQYGNNSFTSNDEIVLDNATGLMWQQDDSKKAMNWKDSLNYCRDLSLAGYDDWKLPNAKELHSIVDYTRSPETTNSAAINEIFNSTRLRNENAQKDFAAYWSSTTHKNQKTNANAVYINFGKSLGNMRGNWLDVHGAGAQRSDPKDISNITGKGYSKTLDKNRKMVVTHGPQGDVVRDGNFVRCVRTTYNEEKQLVDASRESSPAKTYSSFKRQYEIMDSGYSKEKPSRLQSHSVGKRKPPQFALEACENKRVNENCKVNTPSGKKVVGQCRNTPDGSFACVPSRKGF